MFGDVLMNYDIVSCFGSTVLLMASTVCFLETKLDKFPNHLTPVEKELCLVDAGYFINTSCPPLLRKERKVDVILSFDYNLVETRFHVIVFQFYI